jgi:hypothetical protein
MNVFVIVPQYFLLPFISFSLFRLKFSISKFVQFFYLLPVSP